MDNCLVPALQDVECTPTGSMLTVGSGFNEFQSVCILLVIMTCTVHGFIHVQSDAVFCIMMLNLHYWINMPYDALTNSITLWGWLDRVGCRANSLESDT